MDDAIGELRIALAVARDHAARSPTSHAERHDLAGARQRADWGERIDKTGKKLAAIGDR
ncbi:MAG: hypothetical protein ACM31C_16610 [Acidobacteriota bacterium]